MSDYDYLRGSTGRAPLLDKLAGVSEQNKKALYDYMVTNGNVFPDLGRVVNKRVEPTMDPLELIAARLRLPMNNGMRIQFPNLDHLSVYTKGIDTAIVFVVKGNKPLTIEDDPGLFPSDSLITQLRLLMADAAK